MKKRLAILGVCVGALLAVSAVVGLLVYVEERNTEQRNVMHDASWLFMNLPFATDDWSNVKLSRVEQPAEEFRDALIRNRESVLGFDYGRKPPDMSLDLSTAIFAVSDRCRVVFKRSAKSTISVWHLSRIEEP